MTEKTVIVGVVTGIDAAKRKATLRFSDGSSEKFDVREDIDLSKHRVGERVVIQTTETTSIALEKP